MRWKQPNRGPRGPFHYTEHMPFTKKGQRRMVEEKIIDALGMEKVKQDVYDMPSPTPFRANLKNLRNLHRQHHRARHIRDHRLFHLQRNYQHGQEYMPPRNFVHKDPAVRGGFLNRHTQTHQEFRAAQAGISSQITNNLFEPEIRRFFYYDNQAANLYDALPGDVFEGLPAKRRGDEQFHIGRTALAKSIADGGLNRLYGQLAQNGVLAEHRRPGNHAALRGGLNSTNASGVAQTPRRNQYGEDVDDRAALEQPGVTATNDDDNQLNRETLSDVQSPQYRTTPSRGNRLDVVAVPRALRRILP